MLGETFLYQVILEYESPPDQIWFNVPVINQNQESFMFKFETVYDTLLCYHQWLLL